MWGKGRKEDTDANTAEASGLKEEGPLVSIIGRERRKAPDLMKRTVTFYALRITLISKPIGRNTMTGSLNEWGEKA